MDTTELRTWLNFIDSFDSLSPQSDPIARSLGEQVYALIAEHIPNEEEQHAYFGVAMMRVQSYLAARKYTRNEEGAITLREGYTEQTPAQLQSVAQAIYNGVTVERRRSAGRTLYNDMPQTPDELVEVPDRRARFLGLNLWTVRTQDEAEELLDRCLDGEFTWAKETYGDEVNNVLNNLGIELTNRFENETGVEVIESARHDEDSYPMFLAKTQDGLAWWFRYRYESRGKQLQIQVWTGESRGWIDADVRAPSTNEFLDMASYSVGGVW